ncbi:MAG: chorismate-binding protein, partial [Halieaceae bacterium]|nr:chorismate-binding protein [Halieaceae bacterium]
MTDRQAFDRLVAEGYNLVPVTRTVLADTETPVSAYQKLARGPYSFLFESVQGGEKWGRYSIIGLPARRWLAVHGHSVTLYEQGEAIEQCETDDPLAFIEQAHNKFHSAPLPGLPVFHGGLVGYFGYDTVRYIEHKLQESCPKDVLGTPDILLMIVEEVLVFDNLAGTLTLVVNAEVGSEDAWERANARLDTLEKRLPGPAPALEPIEITGTDTTAIEALARFTTTQAEFEGWVDRIREYIVAGDVMQVVPSQRMTVPYSREPLSLYRALRNLNPSPYLYFLDLGDFQIVGSSPEILVRAEQGQITVRPIAGTRRRGQSEAEDAA